MSRKKRDDFPSKIKTRVALRAGHHCSNPDCKRSTVGPSSEAPDAIANIGVAAHICAASPGGRRYDRLMTPEQRASIDNAIWLCGTCSVLIDRDETKYTSTVLKEWKARHEASMSNSLEGKQAHRDERILEMLSMLTQLPKTVLETIVSIAPSGPEQGIEITPSAAYSEDKDAIIVAADLGNELPSRLTITNVTLDVPEVRNLRPRQAPPGFCIPGHQWSSLSPFELEREQFARVAWYFDVVTLKIKERLAEAQPIACTLILDFFPRQTVIRCVDLYSMARLRQMSDSRTL